MISQKNLKNIELLATQIVADNNNIHVTYVREIVSGARNPKKNSYKQEYDYTYNQLLTLIQPLLKQNNNNTNLA